MGIPLSSLARVMADVGALAGVPLVEAGAAIDGARLAAAASRGPNRAEDAEGVPLASRDACARLISELADIREARVLDGAFHDETSVPGWIPPALEMYASDTRLRAAYAAWTAFGSTDPRIDGSASPNVAWERSVAEADERRRLRFFPETSPANVSRKKREPRSLRAKKTSLKQTCARAGTRKATRAKGTSGSVSTRSRAAAPMARRSAAPRPPRRLRPGPRAPRGVPDARRRVGAAHASRDAAAFATARARVCGDALDPVARHRRR